MREKNCDVKVSVVIPVFNNQATIAGTLASVLAQRFDGGVEVIVVNDGSTDGTRAVLTEFGDRIRVIDQRNLGVSAARNAGIAAAAGEYIALLDGDDIWMEDKLARTVPVLDTESVMRRGILRWDAGGSRGDGGRAEFRCARVPAFADA